MSDARAGSLDNPGRYGCRSLAVYFNSTKGYYYKLPPTNCREKVNGNQLWTSTGDVKMRGSAPVDDTGGRDTDSGDDSEDDEDRQQLAAAIAASLQDDGPAWPDVPMNAENVVPSADAAAADGAGNATGPSAVVASLGASRECSICLTEPSVMLMRPCNHICVCQTCARSNAGRIVRQPCVICRKMVTKVERVYF